MGDSVSGKGTWFFDWGTWFPESGTHFLSFEIKLRCKDIFAASRKAKLSGVDRLKIRPYYWILDPIKQILLDFWPFSG